MGNRFKYNDGDLIGPHQILLIKRTVRTPSRHWKGLFLCPLCGETFEAYISAVVKGETRSCGCYHKQLVKEMGLKNKGRILSTRLDLTGQIFGYLTVLYPLKDKKYGRNVFWHCKCKCGNEIDANTSQLKSRSVSSCGCLKSKGEYKIIQLLQSLNITFETQKSFKDCINPNTGRLLFFDFYLPDYNILIEYDGAQHYKDGWESVDVIKYRDEIKNQYCKKNDIKLIRIPYYDFNLLDENYIINKLEE